MDTDEYYAFVSMVKAHQKELAYRALRWKTYGTQADQDAFMDDLNHFVYYVCDKYKEVLSRERYGQGCYSHDVAAGHLRGTDSDVSASASNQGI